MRRCKEFRFIYFKFIKLLYLFTDRWCCAGDTRRATRSQHANQRL